MYLVLLIAATLLGDGCTSANVHKHIKLARLDNNIELTDVPIKQSSETKFLSITQHLAPSYRLLKKNDVTHLTCEALGAPAPNIHWYMNDVPIYELFMESNQYNIGNPSSVARVSSTLLVNWARDQDRFTCVASTGSQVARTSTVIYRINGSGEIPEQLRAYPMMPQIMVWYKVYVDTIGNKVVIPCRARGMPSPAMYWINNKGAVIENDPRMKKLHGGELMISSLQWSDMGEYTCVAINIFGSASAKTFVYPAKAS